MDVGPRAAWSIPFAFGAAAQAAQVVLARELLTVFCGNELSVALVFGVWLFWVALGSALARGASPVRMTLAAAFLQLAALPLAIAAIRDLRSWFETPTGHYLPIGGLALAAGGILAIPCFLFGAQFAWAVRIVGRTGPTYGAEAAGAAAGAVVAALLAPLLGSFMLAAVAVAAPFAALAGRRAAVVGLVAAALLAASSGVLERWTHERYWKAFGTLVETHDSPHGPVAVVERGGEVSIYRSGRLWATLPERGESAPVACAIMLQHPSPWSVFLAGGSATLLREILQHGVWRVDAVESEERIFELIEKHDPGAVGDARVRRLAGDARRVLRSSERYDVVVVAAGEPDTALANRFYTAEFFALAREHLAPGGVFAVGSLAAPSSYAASELLARNATVHRTLASAFKKVLVTPGSGAWLLASDGELTLDDSEIAMRAEQRGRGQVNLPWLTERFYVDKANSEFRTGRAYDPLAEESWVPPQSLLNADARPVGYFESLRAWTWQSGDAAGAALAAAAAVPVWVVFALAAVPGLFRRRGVAMFCVGFAGMAVPLGALLGFQAAVGNLHATLGFLVAAYMVGAAVGAQLRVPPRWALAATALACAGLLVSSSGVWLAALMPLAGAAVGACYRALADEQSAARLYALDVAGGCVAALLVVPFVVPMHGIVVLGALAGLPCALAAVRAR